MCQLLGVRCLSLVTITDALLYLGGLFLLIQMAKKQIAMQDIYIYVFSSI